MQTIIALPYGLMCRKIAEIGLAPHEVAFFERAANVFAYAVAEIEGKDVRLFFQTKWENKVDYLTEIITEA